MNEIQSIPNRIGALPLELQRQILDYIDFIVNRYQSTPEISDETKAFIDQRMQKMKDNPQDNLAWSEARKEIHQKLGWE